MQSKPVKTEAANLTRRELLGAAALAALGLSSDAGRGDSPPSTSPPASMPSTRPAVAPAPPWWLTAYPERSRVVDIRAADVATREFKDPFEFGELIARGLEALTGADAPEKAWQQILGDARRIAIKVNRVGAEVLGSSEPMVRALVDALSAAGYEPGRLHLIEVPEALQRTLGTRPAPEGWGPPIVLAGRPEPLARYLYEVDALINVPFLKTHQIAGMSGALKNLSHALVRHPARWHANGCSPFVGDVVGSEPVSSKLKLTISNAVRLVVNHGPDATTKDVSTYGGILLGMDPVAVDDVGLDILHVERRRVGLNSPLDVRYLGAAVEAGVGRAGVARVERVAIELPH